MTASRRIFLAEVREQPAALLTLLEHLDAFVEVGRACAERKPTTVRLVAHGSSDAAAAYGVYAFGLLPGWTALRDSITLTVYYGAELDLRGSTVIGLSQSGRTPDVVDYVERARAAGAFTVALTNDPQSELAEQAEAVLPLAAGPERSIAATKTYTNQVAALALLAGHAAGRGAEVSAGIHESAARLDALIAELEPVVPRVALAFAFVGRMFVIGRGPEFATAREIALKLLETCRVAAEPLTATDLAHGPVAALDPNFPVWTIADDDAALPAVLEAVARVRAAGATLLASGSAAGRVEGAEFALPSTEAPIPLLGPLVSVVPGQLFAWGLARAKGLDPDRPVGLAKVTVAL